MKPASKKKQKLEAVVAAAVKAYIFPLAWLGGKNEMFEKGVLRPIAAAFSKLSKINFVQYATFPKNIDSKKFSYKERHEYDDVAIVMQGPICYEDNFTLNTVRLYHDIFPHSKIIVSTWKGVGQDVKEALEKAGCIVVENSVPAKKGAGNINLQLKSSYAGVLKAEELGCRYSIKTRTDQRLYAVDMLQYLNNLIRVCKPEQHKNVKKRIIFTSYGKSFKFVPFLLCDFFAYGMTADLKRLFGVDHNHEWPDDYHNIHAQEEEEYYAVMYKLENLENADPYREFENFNEAYFKYMCAENYIILNYYSKNIKTIDVHSNLTQEYKNFLRNYAVIVDSEQLMMYWPKYTQWGSKKESYFDYMGKLDFKAWLNIYLNT